MSLVIGPLWALAGRGRVRLRLLGVLRPTCSTRRARRLVSLTWSPGVWGLKPSSQHPRTSLPTLSLEASGRSGLQAELVTDTPWAWAGALGL